MRKLNNKGFTLVELIISMAATVIVMGAIIMFMTNGQKYYQKINSEASIQTEGQIVMNQLADMMLTANWVHVEPDQVDVYDMSDADHGSVKTIKRNAGLKKLLLTEYSKPDKSIVESAESLMGEYFTGFEVTPADPDFITSRSITIRLKLEKNGRKEEISNTITMRNEPVKPAIYGGP